MYVCIYTPIYCSKINGEGGGQVYKTQHLVVSYGPYSTGRKEEHA